MLLNLDGSARYTALASGGISVPEQDHGIVMVNPALQDTGLHNKVSLNFMDYMGGSVYGQALYSRHFGKFGTWTAGLQAINYGKMRRFDEFEQDLGNFVAGEYKLSISTARAIDSNYRVGANLHIINSVLDQWSSFGVAVDIAAMFNFRRHLLSGALVLRNVGFQIKPYVKGNRERLPMELRAGITKKLRHAPLLFSLTYDNIQRWNLTYLNPNDKPETDPLTGEPEEVKPPGFFEKLGRHLVISTELTLGKVLYVGAGFNYRRRRELATESRPALSGFSVGAGIRVKRFELAYAHTGYHRAAGSNMFTLMYSIAARR
jgi:hypothetical protein